MKTAAVTKANLDKFSYIGLISSGTASGFGRGGRGSPIPVGTPAPSAFEIKTVYNGAMADPADFNKKVKVFFLAFFLTVLAIGCCALVA